MNIPTLTLIMEQYLGMFLNWTQLSLQDSSIKTIIKMIKMDSLKGSAVENGCRNVFYSQNSGYFRVAGILLTITATSSITAAPNATGITT